MVKYRDIEVINKIEEKRRSKEEKIKRSKELNPLIHIAILSEQYFNSL